MHNLPKLKPRKLKDLATPQHAFDNDSNLIGEQLQSSGPLKIFQNYLQHKADHNSSFCYSMVLK